MTDCLIIGFNESSFAEYVDMVQATGEGAGAYKDLSLALVRMDGRPVHALDTLDHFYHQDRPGPRFHNADFFWPVVQVLGSYLHQQGLSFDYVNLFQQEKDKLRHKLAGDVRTVAITTTLYVSPHPIREIVSFIRQHNQKARIIVGGPYIAGQPKMLSPGELQQLFKYLGADLYVISNEGEATLARLLRALKQGSDLGQVGNLAYRNGDEFAITLLSPEYNALEDHPVDYTLFPPDEIGRFLSVRTAKSCPFSCAFCGFPQRAGKYKYLGVDHVEALLDRIRDIGTVDTLTFLDDTFNVPPKRFKEILRMMIRKRYGLRWNSFYRSDHGDDETIELMARAGCEGVFLGIESGSNRMLKLMNKTSSREAYMRAIPRFRAAGISTYASIIIGFPGETMETYGETWDFIEQARPDFFRAQLWYADPITPIWKKREELNLAGAAFNWSHATMDADTACELIDRMFLGIEGSIWLPQFGFEQWSTFYLQRHGMSMAQIKTFLRCFNAAIKERLLFRDRKPLGGALRAALAHSSQFDRGVAPDLAPVDALDGARYIAAERFFAGSLAGSPEGGLLPWAQAEDSQAPATPTAPATPAATETPITLATFDCPVPPDLLQRATARSGATAAELALAAFHLLLLRLSGQEHGGLLLALDPGLPVPVCLRTPWTRSLAQLAHELGQSWQAARPHRAYGLPLLDRPLLLRLAGGTPPLMNVGCMSAAALAEVERLFPDAARALTLVLEPPADDAPPRLRYRPDRIAAGNVEHLAGLLARVLAWAAEDTGRAVGSIPLEDSAASPAAAPVPDDDEEAQFSFA